MITTATTGSATPSSPAGADGADDAPLRDTDIAALHHLATRVVTVAGRLSG